MEAALVILASVAGIASLLYIAIIGQKSIPEWWRERKRKGALPETSKPTLLEVAWHATGKIPSNLPSRGEFIGREKEKAQVREALRSRSYLVSIDGIGGIGKTSLALEIVYESLEAKAGVIQRNDVPVFDAFIWTTAKDRELALNDLLDTIARTLGAMGIVQLPPQEKIEEVRGLLRLSRCLLIVDNFETVKDDAVQNFLLLSLPEPSKALVTSRHQLLRQAWEITLHGMERGEALSLIRDEGKRLGLESVSRAEDKTLMLLYEATGGNPQAIKMSIGQIKHEGLSLDAVLKRLYDARDGIFDYMFSRDWELLSNEAKCVLMVMPLFSGAVLKAAIEATSDVHHFYFENALKQLVEMFLIDARGELEELKQRYSVHPLTRAFAAAKLDREPDFKQQAQHRFAHYYAEFAKQYGGYQNWTGYDILASELDNVFTATDWAYQSDEQNIATDLTRAMDYFLWIRGYWRRRIRYGEQAVEVYKKLGDARWQGWTTVYTLAFTYYGLGDLKTAQSYAENAKAIAGRIDDKCTLAYALRVLGMILLKAGNYPKSKDFLEKSIALWQYVDDSRVRANEELAWTKMGLAGLLSCLENHDEARRVYEECKATFEQLDNTSGIGDVLLALGETARFQKQFDDASAYLQNALKIAERIGKQTSVAECKREIALVEEERSNLVSALQLAKESYEISQRLGARQLADETQKIIERLNAQGIRNRTREEYNSMMSQSTNRRHT